MVWIHGGAFMFGGRDNPPLEWQPGLLFQAAIDAGMAVASIDYRHAREASFPAQLHDAKAAVQYLRHFGDVLGVDEKRIAVWGESAGGHLAALLGLVDDPDLEGDEGVVGPNSSVCAVVDFYGISDIATMPPLTDGLPAGWAAEYVHTFGALPPEPIDVLLEKAPWERVEAQRLASPTAHVRADAPAFLLIHGEADRIVPIQQSEVLLAGLVDAGAIAELIRVPNANHVFMGTDPAIQVHAAVAFLAQHLRP